nr:MAG TPA: Receptor tyrosine-protein kinase erbB-3 [Caudoviricetes sp.]
MLQTPPGRINTRKTEEPAWFLGFLIWRGRRDLNPPEKWISAA